MIKFFRFKKFIKTLGFMHGNRSCTVGSINIYNKNGKVFCHDSGYIDLDGNNSITEIMIDAPTIKRAKVVNFDRNDVFFVKRKDDHELCYDVYIPDYMIKVVPKGNVKDYETIDEYCTRDEIQLKIKSGYFKTSHSEVKTTIIDFSINYTWYKTEIGKKIEKFIDYCDNEKGVYQIDKSTIKQLLLKGLVTISPEVEKELK